ncbi:MAG: YggS family pyridoxal phosphate-dependent enzyme [Parachlamydiaceae bacterium]|nr:YggS family pyridoxal phosphate-dependent enzyme [Parachlamydiaceae bacterium]
MSQDSPAHHFLHLKSRIDEIARDCNRNPEDIQLVAVTKYCSKEMVEQVYEFGGRDFGESRIQEGIEKVLTLPEDIRWHFIGSLQLNKVSKAVQYFNLIHSVDSFKLAKKISEVSIQMGIDIPILLEVNTSGEITKHGFTIEECREKFDELNQLPNIILEGLMTIAPFTTDEKVIRRCFSQLRELREELRVRAKDPLLFCHLSMGMSNDYSIAIEEGATILRIGSAIFK